jgi:hypothetical protein
VSEKILAVSLGPLTSFDAGLDPLLYFRGSYRRLHFD